MLSILRSIWDVLIHMFRPQGNRPVPRAEELPGASLEGTDHPLT